MTPDRRRSLSIPLSRPEPPAPPVALGAPCVLRFGVVGVLCVAPVAPAEAVFGLLVG